MPWRGDVKSRSRLPSDLVSHLIDLSPNAGPTSFNRNHDAFGTSGRSYSSPLPHSFLDIVAPESADVFTPLPIVIPNYFSQVPRELQLQIFSSLIVLHEVEHDRTKADGQWTVLKASSARNQWVGRDRGIRELVRLSRVSGIL